MAITDDNNKPQGRDKEVDHLFLILVHSLSTAAMLQLGKTANPATGKIERDLIAAKHTIDLLLMIKQKTQGNLTDRESLLLTTILADLELNYVDELKKEDNGEKSPDKTN
ncbi:MAG: DUF1844 domain-containing protein [Elusimicrobiota bacterium]